MIFSEVKKELLFTKNDVHDPRLGEYVITKPSKDSDFYIQAYPDDEGIKNNGGRLGANLAPDQIRTALYKMTPALEKNKKISIYDVGNLQIDRLDLNQRHIEAKKSLIEILKQNKKIITLGGGHDYGYPDGAAFIENTLNTSNERPLVLNFDAHLDVRPLKDKINSGTPFFRLLTDYKDQFDFIEIGVQAQCNSQTHLDWLKTYGGQYITLDQIINNELSSEVDHLLKKIKAYHRPTFISLDIDVFSQAFAPGCSQSWPIGLDAIQFKKCFDFLLENLNTKILGVYEVSPPLDVDSRTSKLAAQIIHHFLYF